MQNLFASNPAQAAWRNLTAESKGKAAGFVDFDWMANLCAHGACEASVAAAVPDAGIYATLYEKAGSYDQAWDPDVQFVSTSDFFK